VELVDFCEREWSSFFGADFSQFKANFWIEYLGDFFKFYRVFQREFSGDSIDNFGLHSLQKFNGIKESKYHLHPLKKIL
jgi:hypothetical protein